VFPTGTGSNYDPIELLGVTRIEFESLLDFLYDGMHNETSPPLAAWCSLLSISTRFEMKRIRSRAICEISTFRPCINPVDQVVLATKHAIPEWLPLGYAALCQREEPIEIEEAKKLGLEITVMLAKAREAVRKTSAADQSSNSFSSIGNNSIRPASSDFRVYPPWFGQKNHQINPDPTPFDKALVSRVVDEIFWPAQTLPNLEKSSCNTPDRPSVELAKSESPSPEFVFPRETSPGLQSDLRTRLRQLAVTS